MIMLESLHIESFGKFKDYTLELSDGFNVLYGANEAGKTTLCAFLAAMFYSLPNNQKKHALRDNPRMRYMPWDGEIMAGSVTFTHGSRRVMIERRMGENKRKDKLWVRDADTWEPIALPAKEEPGKYFLGIGQDAFMRTLYTGQLGSAVTGSGEDELLARLTNLSQTGEEDASCQRVAAELTRARNTLVSVSGRVGRIPALEAEAETLRGELEAAHAKLTQHREDIVRKKQLDAEADRLHTELDALGAQKQQAARAAQAREYRRLTDERHSLEKRLHPGRVEALDARLSELSGQAARYAALEGVSRDEYKRLTDLQRRADELRRKEDEAGALLHELHGLEKQLGETQAVRGINIPMLLVSIAVLASGVVCGILVSPLLWFLTLVGVFLGTVACLGIREKQETDRRRQSLEALIADKRAAWEAYGTVRLEAERENAEAERDGLLEQFGVQSPDGLLTGLDALDALHRELEAVRRERALVAEAQAQVAHDIARLNERLRALDFTDEELEALRGAPDAGELDAQIAQCNEQLRTCEADRREVAYSLEHRLEGVREPDIIASELEQKQTLLDECRAKYDALTLACETLDACYEERKRDFAPALSGHVRDILTRMSGGRYTDVRVDDAYGVTLRSADGGPVRNAGYVSDGTYDMVYLALRLGLVQTVMEGGAPFLVLDDSFVQYDEPRIVNAVRAISETFPGVQTLYFTCHRAFVSLMENAGLPHCTVHELAADK